MTWIQFSIETNQHNAQFCSDCLMSVNALAVTFEDAKEDPLFEPAPNTEPLWQHTRVIGLFENDADVTFIKDALHKNLSEKEYQSLKIEMLCEKDWVTETNKTESLHFGENFWIVPTGYFQDNHKKPDAAATYVTLDAGLAFGTGTHPTTALCLQWLAKNSPKGLTVLDYGCGSGILAISAKMLGADQVIGVDHDPQALYSTKVNAEKNGIAIESIPMYLPEEWEVQKNNDNKHGQNIKVDLILANILAEPLMRLAQSFAEWLAPGGSLVLSGILGNQIAEIEKYYSTWFCEFDSEVHDGWARIYAKKINDRLL